MEPLRLSIPGWALGLIVGVMACGFWEALVRSNTLLRGPGPLSWGIGLLFTAAGVRGAVIGPNQLHPVPSELAAAILIWLGFWIERRVVREVLGMPHHTASVGSSRAM